MNELEIRLNSILSKAVKEPINISDTLVEEFGEKCKDILKKQFNKEREKEFRLRMSNIGKDLRQLHLDKEFGEIEVSPSAKLNFVYGDIIEALLIVLFKHSGVQVEGESEETSLQISGEEIKGEYDLIYKDQLTGDNYLIDIKTASPYSYDNKFKDYQTLKDDDPFGYRLQGFGYDTSQKKVNSSCFKGWFVVNKVNGSFKFVEVPESEYQDECEEALRDIVKVVDHFKYDKSIPPCPGVKKETWYKKETGEKIIADGPKEPCQWCKRKDKCHPEGEYKKGKGTKYYTYIDKNKEVSYENPK